MDSLVLVKVEKRMIAKNPVLSGFYPDPSICRVGESFYMVNSTFAYFPGVPVFRSRNLVQWEQIGNVLERESQVPLRGCGHSEGIYAPTIRYHDGTFYMITTNVSGGGNFIVTAKEAKGPWSEPYYLGEAAKGIDPSLFFDEDGACYYIGQRENSAGGQYFGDCEIWIQRLDPAAMKLTGEAKAVLYGFQRRAVWPEGPHLYRKDGYYYILHAESGTEQNHCVVIARSRNVWGPYEYCPFNPILTHRHLGKSYPVTCVGHGDLVEDRHGNWYMVMLGCRPQQGYTLMGRETFLAEVVWEDGWPVVNPGIGRLKSSLEVPGEIQEMTVPEKRVYDFSGTKLPAEFVMLRNPAPGTVSVGEREGCLRLSMTDKTLKEEDSPAFAAVRQRDRAYEVRTVFEVHFTGRNKEENEEGAGECAGLAIMQNDRFHIRLEYFQKEKDKGVRVVRCSSGKDTVLAVSTVEEKAGTDKKKMHMKITVDGLRAAFYYVLDDTAKENWIPIAENVELYDLSTERAGGFVGCTVGMYASANGRDSGGYADFSEFIYAGH